MISVIESSTPDPLPSGAPLEAVIEAARLHPLARDVVKAFADALPPDQEPPETIRSDAVAARAFLAGVAEGVLEHPSDSRYLVNLAALALVVLSVAHELETTNIEPCELAQESVVWTLESSPATGVIRSAIRRMLGDARDQILLDAGRREFVHGVRHELRRLVRLQPRVVDVLPRTRRLVVGGVLLSFVRSDGRGHRRIRALKTSNLPGQLLLLLALGHVPRDQRKVHPTVLSWARQALARATHRSVSLGTTLELVPQLALTKRAREIGTLIANADKA